VVEAATNLTAGPGRRSKAALPAMASSTSPTWSGQTSPAGIIGFARP